MSTIRDKIKLVRKFLTRNLNEQELDSYRDYVVNDNINSTDWIYKTSVNRDYILSKNLSCNTCNTQIQIKETGKCSCVCGNANTIIYDMIIEAIYTEDTPL